MFRIVAVLRLCSSVQSLNRVRAGMGVAHLYTRMVADTHADYCSLTTTLVRLYIRFTKRARFYAPSRRASIRGRAHLAASFSFA
jgi:hypothetical protein